MPKSIQTVIKKEFEGIKIDEIEHVEHHLKGLYYDIEFIIDGNKKDVEFNSDGLILN